MLMNYTKIKFYPEKKQSSKNFQLPGDELHISLGKA